MKKSIDTEAMRIAQRVIAYGAWIRQEKRKASGCFAHIDIKTGKPTWLQVKPQHDLPCKCSEPCAKCSKRSLVSNSLTGLLGC